MIWYENQTLIRKELLQTGEKRYSMDIEFKVLCTKYCLIESTVFMTLMNKNFAAIILLMPGIEISHLIESDS